ncbi:GAF and ANTAR domain-containing protein [Streptomyces sp. CC219B]|uniref:GAF and ANTAR domain-containing protein n=1 Tax=Streptomyces sp. CC219B TaxID=3044574 RepID=UPI0024A7A9F2|nr:GAF and ANTAR domain-containing protein [Streptomyces sp. CC219B]
MTLPPRQQLARAFVDLARSPVTDASPMTGLLVLLAAHGTELFGDCGANVLYRHDGHIPTRVASTDEELKGLGNAAVAWDEGPGPEVLRTGRLVPDTALDGEPARAKWPRYTRRALGLGYRRVAGLPLRVGDATPGALVLFGRGDTPLPADLLELGQSLADATGWALEQDRRLRESRTLAAQLDQALTSRIVIEQAKGTLAARLSVSPDQAFEVLRAYARSHRLRLPDVALDVVERRRDLGRH